LLAAPEKLWRLLLAETVARVADWSPGWPFWLPQGRMSALASETAPLDFQQAPSWLTLPARSCPLA